MEPEEQVPVDSAFLLLLLLLAEAPLPALPLTAPPAASLGSVSLRVWVCGWVWVEEVIELGTSPSLPPAAVVGTALAPASVVEVVEEALVPAPGPDTGPDSDRRRCMEAGAGAGAGMSWAGLASPAAAALVHHSLRCREAPASTLSRPRVRGVRAALVVATAPPMPPDTHTALRVATTSRPLNSPRSR